MTLQIIKNYYYCRHELSLQEGSEEEEKTEEEETPSTFLALALQAQRSAQFVKFSSADCCFMWCSCVSNAMFVKTGRKQIQFPGMYWVADRKHV
jgi:hypothetical protein